MSVVANIISAVIKSVLGDKIGNELVNEVIGISIDGVSEKGIDRISDFINGEKAKIENVLSKENMESLHVPEENHDYVVAEIKVLLSVVEITDEILRQCKYDSTNLSVFLWNEYCELKKDYIECGSDIKKGVFAVSEALIKIVRESEEFEKDVLIHISNSADDTNAVLQKISEYMEENFNKLSADNRTILEILHLILKQNQDDSAKKTVKSRTQEYADKWNENMFLNNFDKRDEHAGVNVKLSEVYLDQHLPHYIWGNNKNATTDLKALLKEHIYPHDDSKMLLILGQPGIGKSTLITWITAKFKDRINDILVYKFASDLGNADWQDGIISDRILEELCLNYGSLKGKTLILDGFDEVSIEDNKRRDILDSLYFDWINNNRIKGFTLIITCRENYIQRFEHSMCKYITLQPWDEIQINSFCRIFQKKTKNDISESTIKKLLENMDILGIPLILYMVLALNISIEKEGSIVDVYDKIFALDGGIYDRCIDFKSFSEKHRIGEIKEQIHQISRDIAIWMFENEPEEAYIPQNEYQSICDSIMSEVKQKNKNIQQDFLIGNYIKLRHCEGLETEKLYFVHRSIYEYFVAETIYSSIPNTMKKFSKEYLDEFAGIVSVCLKKGQITQTICKYLRHKILKLCSAVSQEELTFYQWMEMAVDKMLDKGMFYSSEYGNCNNIIYKEVNCFTNLVEILRQLHKKDNGNYILVNVSRRGIEKYIKYCCVTFEENKENYLNLNKTFLENVNLAGTNLSNINFKNAMLEKSNLSRANLEKANLSGATLKRANLESAILNNADFSNADLSRVDLTFSNLTGTVFKNTVLKESVLVEASFEKANLTNAELEKANLRGANLERANLNGANLSNADLSRAIIIDANLTGTILYNVILTNAIIDKKQVGYFEGKCDLQDSWVLYNDELIRYEEFKSKAFDRKL